MVLHSSIVELFEGKIDLADMRRIEGTRKNLKATRETQHQVPARTPRTGRERRAHTEGALHPPRQ